MKEYAITHRSDYAVMRIDNRHFLEALTRWNYFPNQKASAMELPPNISTRRFTPEVARKLIESIKVSDERKPLGFDLVEYRATRYNNVSRILGLIHPLAFARIFEVFEANHENLTTAMKDENSAIQVEAHNDGRMLIMNYEDHETKAMVAIDQSFGKKFRAHTDVANCFASVYTHSLEWAIQGFEIAKSNLAIKKGPRHWSAHIDQALRWAKRNETSGLPVGPASSSIAVEVILSAVDQKLRDRFSFVRYVDDYTALCESHESAQEFILALGKELSLYRLNLNLAKTSIVELPEPLQEKWVSDLMNAAPPALRDDGQLAFMDTSDALQFLDHAVRLNNETPDGSIVKFAIAAISRRLKDRAAADVFKYVLNLSWHYPILLPYLEQIDARSEYYDREILVERLNKIIAVNVAHRRSDGICWALYYLDRLKSNPSEDSIVGVISSGDSVAITMLCTFEVAVERVTEYAKNLIDNTSLYVKDQNWLLLYRLYLMGKINDPYEDEKTFEILREYEVDFFCQAGKNSRAEDYCEYISNPFIPQEEMQNFDQWMTGA